MVTNYSYIVRFTYMRLLTMGVQSTWTGEGAEKGSALVDWSSSVSEHCERIE